MLIPRVYLAVAPFHVTPGVRLCIALAAAGVALSACGSSHSTPTAPTAASSADPAPLSEGASPSASASAASSTIKINGGTLALATLRTGTVALKGSHGFRFDGYVQSGAEPAASCGIGNPCLPGATVPFTATWLGTDIPGTARFQGQDYNVLGHDSTGMYISLTGSFVAPAHTADTASVTAPFTATGLFFRGSPLPGLELTGSGRVTFTLVWRPYFDRWEITFTSFDFGNGNGPN
jgi:hypothetical protein